MLHCSNQLLPRLLQRGCITQELRLRQARRYEARSASTLAPGLETLSDFGENPGNLAANVLIPRGMAPNSPLVVVLHGCTQSGTGYARDSGWVELAHRHGFALLIPEQQRANNMNLCFNWFEPGDIRRGRGEAASIMAMIDRVTDRWQIDGSRVFVTGLSAGAAMANVMLAAYPERFAGGGLIAGLPYGVAHSVQSALQAMQNAGRADGKALAEPVRAASDHRGPWPRVSVWHGSTDRTVHPANGDAVAAQWVAVHRLDASAPDQEQVDGFARSQWRDATGLSCVESYTIAGMGHGTPLDVKGGAAGSKAPFVLDVGISSSDHLLKFWGLADGAAAAPRKEPQPRVDPRPLPSPRVIARAAAPILHKVEHGVEKIINDALRAAGLLK